MHRSLLAVAAVALTAPAAAQGVADEIRVATFNAFLNRSSAGELITDLSTPNNPQAQAVAELIQRNDPDVVLLCEFDYDAAGQAAALFQQNYLDVSQNGAAPVDYPHVFLAPSNTGVASGFDLDNDGTIETTPGSVAYGNDAFGFGFFEGQFAMVLLSKHPIDTGNARTFQNFLWRDMPGALLPDDPATPAPADWFSPAELDVVRLSSKSHWDVPVQVGGQSVHVLCAHPTPPIFDGPEDRNGRRNHDEIRFWADYVAGAQYMTDDNGLTGGLAPGEHFVICGDYNADPVDGDGVPGAIQQLIENPLVVDPKPRSLGGLEAALRQGGANLDHAGGAVFDTGDFTDVSMFFSPSGNLRVDYALPSATLTVLESAVVWPGEGQPLFDLVGPGDPANGNAVVSSDHRLVYVDVSFGAVPVEPGIPAQIALDFIGEEILPTSTVFNGTAVGGLSALVFDAQTGLYSALSDDRSSLDDARFYNLTLDLSDGALGAGDLEFRDVVTLTDMTGAVYPNAGIDPEGLALEFCGTQFLSSEGDANAGLDPFIGEFSLTGRELDQLPVPAHYLTGTPNFGIRNNLAFESLTIDPDQTLLYTATENALFQDGPAATTTNGSPCRIMVYDLATRAVTAEYVYEAEAVAADPIPAGSFSTNGLVELLSLGDGKLIAVERSFSVGVGNAIRLYLVDVAGATDISGQPTLQPGYTPVQKSLLLDLDDLGITLDNVEAIAFGPYLPDGRRSIVLASDNNFNATQFTQFLAFAVDNGADVEAYCFGGAALTPCPCGNDGAPGRGCANSASADGALLSFSGSTIVGNDDLVLTVTEAPVNTFGVIYVGGSQTVVPFGDGLRCVDPGPPGALLRFPVQFTGASGSFSAGPGIIADSAAILGSGGITAGSTWNFQAYFRDSFSGPCGSGFNFSNALSVTFEN